MSGNITTEELDACFDAGQDILHHFDTSKAMSWEAFTADHHLIATEHVDLEMPCWLVQILDTEAQQLNISRAAVMTTWLAEKARGLLREGMLPKR
jgi:hypothetical protein